MGLFGNNKESQFQTRSPVVNPTHVQRNQAAERGSILDSGLCLGGWGGGGGSGCCCKRRFHWRKLEVLSVVTSHWLSSGRLPLAELFLGRRTLFLHPVGGADLSLPVGVGPVH